MAEKKRNGGETGFELEPFSRRERSGSRLAKSRGNVVSRGTFTVTNGSERYGGETGIRTLDTLSRIHAFQACAFSHSAISPAQRKSNERQAREPAPKIILAACARDRPQPNSVPRIIPFHYRPDSSAWPSNWRGRRRGCSVAAPRSNRRAPLHPSESA